MPRLLSFMLRASLVVVTCLFGLRSVSEAMAQEVHESDQMVVQLVSETTSPKPGSIVRIALRFAPRPGWHSYWLFPGDAGLATEPTWQLPKGVKMQPLRHPAPQRLPIGTMASFVHEGEHWLLTKMTVPRSLKVGDPLPVKLSLFWGACSDAICMPMKGDFELPLVVGEGNVSEDMKRLFDRAEARIPTRLSDATMMVDDKSVHVFMPLPKKTDPGSLVFYPEGDVLVESSALGVVNKLKDGRFELVITRKPGSKDTQTLSGVIASTDAAWSFGPLKPAPPSVEPVVVTGSAPTLDKLPDASKSGIFGMPVAGGVIPVIPSVEDQRAAEGVVAAASDTAAARIDPPSPGALEAAAKSRAEASDEASRSLYWKVGLLGLVTLLLGLFFYRRSRTPVQSSAESLL